MELQPRLKTAGVNDPYHNYIKISSFMIQQGSPITGGVQRWPVISRHPVCQPLLALTWPLTPWDKISPRSSFNRHFPRASFVLGPEKRM